MTPATLVKWIWRVPCVRRLIQTVFILWFVLQLINLRPTSVFGGGESQNRHNATTSYIKSNLSKSVIIKDSPSRNAGNKQTKLVIGDGIHPDYAETLPDYLHTAKYLGDTVLLALTDAGFEDMTLNFYLTSVRPLNITSYLFVTTDTRHCENLARMNISCFLVGSGSLSSQACTYLSPSCIQKMTLRLVITLQVLKLGYNVLLSDVDVIFFKNPLIDLSLNYGSSVDIVYSENSGLSSGAQMNGGFVLFRNSTNTRMLIQKALDKMATDIELDDQTALNQVTLHGDNKWRNSAKLIVKQMPLHKYQNGRIFWENVTYSRHFASETAPCTECIMVHNNWIVSLEAKRYRMKENGYWMVDNGYYSCPTRKYLTYYHTKVFTTDTQARKKEWAALQNALFIAKALNRTLILPKFNCVLQTKQVRNCSLLNRLRIETFEQEFPNYREHEFLSHQFVPMATKADQSEVICLQSAQLNDTYFPPCQKLLTTHKSKQANLDVIIKYFQKSEVKIVRFLAIYENSEFFGDVLFHQKLKNGFQSCSYRQYHKHN